MYEKVLLFTKMLQEPSVEAVQHLLISLIEDENPVSKQPAKLVIFAAALLQHASFTEMKDPDKFVDKFVTFFFSYLTRYADFKRCSLKSSLLSYVRASHLMRLKTDTPHHTPHTSHLTPHTSHLTPHTSHLTPHTSHLTPHTSHLTFHQSQETSIFEMF